MISLLAVRQQGAAGLKASPWSIKANTHTHHERLFCRCLLLALLLLLALRFLLLALLFLLALLLLRAFVSAGTNHSMRSHSC